MEASSAWGSWNRPARHSPGRDCRLECHAPREGVFQKRLILYQEGIWGAVSGGRMPGMDGLEVLRQMKRARLPTRVVLLTAALDEDEVMEAITLGVNGVVLKEMAPQFLVQGVRKVHAGEHWLEKQSVGRALERLLRREAGARQLAGILTPREFEIVRIVPRGLRNKETAEKLSISEGTVKIHLHNIYEKLRGGGRLALTLFAQEKGLL